MTTTTTSSSFSFRDYYKQKLPAEERDELMQFVDEWYGSIPPDDRGVLLDEQAAMIRAKRREYNDGQMSRDRASELLYEQHSTGMYETVRSWAQEIGDIDLLKDLERYKDVPEIAVIKHYSFSDFLHRLMKQ